MKQMKDKPLIERAIAQARNAGNTTIYTTGIYQRFLALALSRTSAKFRWSTSALALTDYIRADLDKDSDEAMMPKHGRYHPVIPSNHVWWQFDVPYHHPVLGEITAVLLLLTSDIQTMLEAARSYHPPHDTYERFRHTIEEEATQRGVTWAMLLFSPTGTIKWGMGFAHHDPKSDFVDFTEVPWVHCPTGECGQQTRQGKYKNLCPTCTEILAYWVSWSMAAYRVLSGMFQQEDEQKEPAQQEIVEQCIVKEPRPDKPNKFREVQREHRYHYITFDACVRARPATSPAPERTPAASTHGWLIEAREIDPDSVVYVDHAIASFEREYRHERYVHMRGQRQSVQAHHKRVPVKLARLGQVMTRVVASRFEDAVPEQQTKGELP